MTDKEEKDEIQEEIETLLETEKEPAEDYKDKYFRLLAEQENTRKRLIKEKEELIQYAIQNAIADLLNPLDHLESALSFTDNASKEVQNWSSGFKMILKQFKDALRNQGVTDFHAKGELFDPHKHEAVEMVETEEAAPGTVVDEMQKGYKMGPRTIRPARVRVAKAPEQNNKSNSEENLS